MMEKSAGPQLNQARNDFNKSVTKKAMLGRTKKIQWEARRRFSNI